MRLSAEERAAIRAAATEAFGPEARLRLFGSRVDDAARGGDIDLAVHLPVGSNAGFSEESRFRTRLCQAIGDQKIDILLIPAEGPQSTIQKIAIETGVVL